MYKVGIFIPIYYREELVKTCLDLLAKTNFANLQMSLHLGINGASEDFKQRYLPDYLSKYDHKVFNYIRTYDHGKNMGKPKMINHMTKNWNKIDNDQDYLVIMDSDIEVTNSNWLVNFLKIFYLYNTKIKPNELGALCGNQEGDNVHLADRLGKRTRKIDEFSIVTTKDNRGIAGGVTITPYDLWEKVGGYTTSNFFSCDGQLCIDYHELNRIVAYVEEISFYHPNSDDEYHDWKIRAANNELEKGEEKGYFEYLRK